MTSSSSTPPAGYVENDQDCNDNDADKYIGAECQTGTPCTTKIIDPSCLCAFFDSNDDGICDGLTVCETNDKDSFNTIKLRNNPKKTSSISETKDLPTCSKDVEFMVYNIGRDWKRKTWEEKVEVFYQVHGEEEERMFGEMTFKDLIKHNNALGIGRGPRRNDWLVQIPDECIDSVRVVLTNIVENSSKWTRVDLKELSYCAVNAGSTSAMLETQSNAKLPVKGDL